MIRPSSQSFDHVEEHSSTYCSYSNSLGQCRICAPVFGITSYVKVEANEYVLTGTVAIGKPLTATCEAPEKSLRQRGVANFEDAGCELVYFDRFETDRMHTVLIISYGSAHGRAYCLTQNYWRDRAYARLARNRNNSY